MILLCKLAAAVFVAAVLTLLLKKDQPAFAFLVSACTAAGLLAVVVQQVDPWLDWLRTLGYDPDSKTERGGTLAEAVRQEASQSAAAIGRSFREGTGLT